MHRRAEIGLQPLDLVLHLLAQVLVQGTQRLVHEQQAGLVDGGAGQGHALLLAAGELRWTTLAHSPPAAPCAAPPRPARVDAGLRHLPHAQRKADVLRHRHVREQGVVLEHHADVAPVGRDGHGVAPRHAHGASRGRDETGRDAEQRRLAGAARPDDREELAGFDREIGRLQRHEVAIALGHALEAHRASLVRAAGSRPRLGRSCLAALPALSERPLSAKCDRQQEQQGQR